MAQTSRQEKLSITKTCSQTRKQRHRELLKYHHELMKLQGQNANQVLLIWKLNIEHQARGQDNCMFAVLVGEIEHFQIEKKHCQGTED